MGAGRHAPAAVSGSSRFEILDKLGVGGMGAVYRAKDRRRGIDVALKTLLETNARSLYRFKREFRALSDVVHPNLVTLYELHTVGDQWFFTMELVSGSSFIQHVRPYKMNDVGQVPVVDQTVTTTAEVDDHTKSTGVWKPRPSGRQLIREGVLDLALLEPALYQLVDGVHALHRLDKLHRDLKPSNVLVDSTGRVVLLDFGLTSDRRFMADDQTHEATAVGTPLYMSPEQAADVPLTNASDWYSVGIMLYEAITGRRPFEGQGRDIFLLKQTEDPPPPSSLNESVPSWLDELCVRLIQRDPRHRPDARAIYKALGREPSTATVQLTAKRVEQPFVGRDKELAVLREAYKDSRDEAVCVFVRGTSGMGKGALVRRFLDDILPEDGAVILQGQCYERESVPYKALDAAVDSLTRYLLQLPQDEVEAIAPRDILSLARLFPVLKRVDAIAHPRVRAFEPVDPQETRRRGFGAMCHMLRCLSKKRPVVLWVDGLQWGDLDSAALLVNLFQHPDPVRILLVGSYRSEDEAASPLLRELRESVLPEKRHAVRLIDLAPLSHAEAHDLIEAVRPDQFDNDEVAAMLRDSNGNPLFLAELARRAADTRSETGENVSLDQLIATRIARLSDDERKVLQVCAVAGHPIPPELCTRAAGLTGEGRAIAALQSERLVRLRHGGEPGQLVETYHDRVRVAALSDLSRDDTRALHRLLATELEATGEAAPSRLMTHWIGAGETARAADAALQAADEAEAILAFHRAAEFYAFAITHQRHDEDTRRALLTKHGHALVRAGRLDEAAEAFAAAAEGASPAERLQLGRLELEQLLRRGHLERGLELSSQVLGAVGRKLPGSDLSAIASLLLSRLRLRLRGMKFTERREEDVPREQLLSADVSWSIASAIAFVSPIRGRALQMKFMRDALELGEPTRVAQAICLEQGYLGLSGAKNWERCHELYHQGLDIAERLGDRQLEGTLESATGLAAFLSGRWAEANEHLIRGEALLRDHAANARWEIDISQIFRTGALIALGKFGELTRLLPIYLREANDRGDVYAARGLRAWRGNITWLVLDRPDEARDHIDAVTVGEEGAFHLHHYYELCSRTYIELYAGDHDAAHTRISTRWRDIKRAQLLRIQTVRVDTWHLRARCALAKAAHTTGKEQRALLKLANTAAHAIASEELLYTTAISLLLRAAVATLIDDPRAARDHLQAAIDAFEAADMGAFAAAARYRLGELMGGDAGDAHVQAASRWLRGEAVVDVAAFVGLLAPGFPAPPEEDGPTRPLTRTRD